MDVGIGRLVQSGLIAWAVARTMIVATGPCWNADWDDLLRTAFYTRSRFFRLLLHRVRQAPPQIKQAASIEEGRTYVRRCCGSMCKSTDEGVREISPCGRPSNFWGTPADGAHLGDGAEYESRTVSRDFAWFEPTNKRTRRTVLDTFSGPSVTPSEARSRIRHRTF